MTAHGEIEYLGIGNYTDGTGEVFRLESGRSPIIGGAETLLYFENDRVPKDSGVPLVTLFEGAEVEDVWVALRDDGAGPGWPFIPLHREEDAPRLYGVAERDGDTYSLDFRRIRHILEQGNSEFRRAIALQALAENGGVVREALREQGVRRYLLRRLVCAPSNEVEAILHPNSEVAGYLVRISRIRGEIIGIHLDEEHHYPLFQFDQEGHEVLEVVRYANLRMGAATDPVGTAEWWITPSLVLGERTPLDLLGEGGLSQDVVDKVWKYEVS